MIRVDHLPLPEGLDAVARMTAPDELSVVVSDLLAPSEQRVAVRAAVRSARLRSWEFGVAPVPVAAGVAVPAVVRHLLASLRAHAVVTAITGSLTAAAAAAAAVLIVAAPPAHPHHTAIGPPAPAYSQAPAARSSAPAGSRAGSRPGNSSAGQPPGTKQRVVTVATPRTIPRPGPQPSPTTSSTAPVQQPPPTTTSPVTSSPPAPQPTPTGTSSSPPPSSGGGQTCVIILGVTVCL